MVYNDEIALINYKKGLNPTYFQTVQAAQLKTFSEARNFAENIDSQAQQQGIFTYRENNRRFQNNRRYANGGNHNYRNNNYDNFGNSFNNNYRYRRDNVRNNNRNAFQSGESANSGNNARNNNTARTTYNTPNNTRRSGDHYVRSGRTLSNQPSRQVRVANVQENSYRPEEN
ncbi:PREDICTED: putative uncharacterized protein DDB_G0283431 [Rhagoletis zephyria]|uniref:putative uncharacterized protein DDB_G0283431 n=1 Tax=Rhagoletis zephyria TaxID=28612 RepID=UPI0008115253|nr:PREDICTED: putative uncharacterized protein DDB_G0283431 [Rhagoletis zephyria]